MHHKNDYIWYVSYGSNLLRQRFMVYIAGGRAPGGTRDQPGCSDHTPPIKDEAIEIPNDIYFGGEAMVYSCGAFIALQPGPKPTKARAYLITTEQFWQVVQQENNWPHPIKRPSISSIRQHGTAVLQDIGGEYAQFTRIIYCGEKAGYPMLSFTAEHQHDEVKKPSDIYLQVMAQGLAESHGLTATQIAQYLADIPGAAGAYTLPELIKALSTVIDS